MCTWSFAGLGQVYAWWILDHYLLYAWTMLYLYLVYDWSHCNDEKISWHGTYILIPKSSPNKYLNILGCPGIDRANIRLYSDGGKATNISKNYICRQIIRIFEYTNVCVLKQVKIRQFFLNRPKWSRVVGIC